jgi:phosphoribosylamine--glycine ligase
MRVLIVDAEAMGLDMAMRFAVEGHEVRWYRYSTKVLRDGEGMKGFEIVPDWRPHMAWAKEGLVITTGNWRFVHELDRYREFGFDIFGPTVASAKLEIERAAGMEAMQAAGIDVPPYQVFDSLADASKFAWKTDRAWVFKPMGDESDKSLTFVADDPAELAGWIDRRISAGKVLKGRCMLQEKIDMLCEMGVSGWFGPEGFLRDKVQIAFEHKKLMDGEIGPATGEQGTICQYAEDEKLADEMLVPLEGILRTLGHRGDFCVGCGIDKAGRAWPFEFTCRLGWPAWFLQAASHRGDCVKWMKDLLQGRDSLRVSYDASIGVVCAQPRYPYNASPDELVIGNPISGIEADEDGVHLVSAMVGRGPHMDGGRVASGQVLQTTGELVLVATALGKTIERARDGVYGIIDRVKFPNKMYRTDIGEKIIDVLPALQKYGYALDLEA